jgi:hypothetical protein
VFESRHRPWLSDLELATKSTVLIIYIYMYIYSYDSYKSKTGNVLSRNIEARFLNHYCHRKTISITYSERVCSLSYSACKAQVPYYIAICGVSDSSIFFHIIS